MPDLKSTIEKGTEEGNVVRVLLCGTTSGGTVVPVQVDPNGKIITTTQG